MVVSKPSLPANPSTPLIKLNELVIRIMVNKERTILSTGGISFIPKKPYISVIRTPPNFIIIPAAINSPMNFFVMDNTKISSLIPKKNIKVAAAAKY